MSGAADRDPMVPDRYRIGRRHEELANGEVFSWVLEPVDSEDSAGRTFAPGQFNMLYVFGAGEAPISLSGIESDGTVEHTIREVGGVTRTMSRLRTGDMVGLRGPFGSAWPLAEARGRDLVIVAGGIGLAPLRPAIRHALGRPDEFGRVVVLCGARQPADILYAGELERWGREGAVDVQVTVDRGSKDWTGHIGVVTRLIERARFDSGNALALVCGPEVMMRFAVKALERRGLDKERIHVSMERNMKCAVGYCGHCQLAGHFVCKDGPVFRFDVIEPLFTVKEL